MINNKNLSEEMVRGSVFNFTSTVIAKAGGIVFTTIILARLLGPELFGIYGIAFSIAAIALTFTDLGISSAALRYISESVGKNNKKQARSYFTYFFKLKILFAAISVFIILALSKFIALDLYKEPLLLLPLFAVSLHILVSSISGMPKTILQALKDFKQIPITETIMEIGKIIFSLIAIIFLTYNLKVPGIFVAIALSNLLVFFYTINVVMKRDKWLIFGKKQKIARKRVLKYSFFVALSSISLVLFGSVDTLVLGAFVDAEFVGFYRAALGLALSISALLSISPILLPILTQVNNEKMKIAVDKTTKYLILLTIPASVGLIILAKPIVNLLYGNEYNFAVLPLYVFSFMIITSSLISLYNPLFQAREKPKILAKAVIISLIMNVLLNFVFIKYFLQFGQEHAIFGAALATFASRSFLAGSLYIKSRKEFDTSIPLKHIPKPLFASIVMAIFVLLVNLYLKINSISLIPVIVSSMAIYFSTLYLIKGITNEEIYLLRYVPLLNKFFKQKD